MVTISGGVDTSIFFPESADRLAAFAHTTAAGLHRANRPLVLSVGFTFRRKGFVEFVQLARLNRAADFVWCGPVWSLRGGLRVAWAKMLRPRNVSFTGYIDRPSKLAAMLNAADAFVALSTEETEGLAVVEALACGVPSLLLNLPTYPVGARAHPLVRVAEIGAQPPELSLLLHDLLRQKKSAAARGRLSDVVSDRSIGVVGEKLRAAYESVLPRSCAMADAASAFAD